MLPCFGAFFYVAARCFSLCLIFWCFWIKPKARKKESKRIFFRSILRETILPLRLCVSCKERIYHLLSPKGGAKSVRREPPSDLIPPPVQCGDSCALCAMIIIRLRPHMAGLRPAGSHCENSGSSDGSGASARSGRAKQRSLLCPLSERGWRHLLLFAVLDLLVLLDQAKSTEKK